MSAGLGRVGVGGGVAGAVAVAEEVGGDAEEVAAELEGVEMSGGFWVEEETAEGFLEEVVGYIAAGGGVWSAARVAEWVRKARRSWSSGTELLGGVGLGFIGNLLRGLGIAWLCCERGRGGCGR